MVMQKMTIKEATREWVREMNRFPTEMIAAILKADPGALREVTTPRVGDRIYVHNYPAYANEENGEIVEYLKDNTYRIKMDDGESILANGDGFEIEYDDFVPMWGWMWQFDDFIDDAWLEEHDGIRKMSECGFRVYKHEEFGYFFGIDGAGYDFYEEHWIPLYKARGLSWHTLGQAEVEEEL